MEKLKKEFFIVFERQFVLFWMVGVLNTLFGYGLYFVFYYIGFEPWSALLLASCMAVVFNFLTMGKFVFKQLHAEKFWRYAVVFVAAYLLNKWLLEAFISTGYHPLIVQAFLAPIVALFSYLSMKTFVFDLSAKKHNA